MSVNPLQIFHSIMTMIADKTLVLLRIKVLIASLGGNPVLGTEATLCRVKMIMHSVHRIVSDIATIAYKFVFLLSVKLSVACLGCASKLFSKPAFG